MNKKEAVKLIATIEKEASRILSGDHSTDIGSISLSPAEERDLKWFKKGLEHSVKIIKISQKMVEQQ